MNENDQYQFANNVNTQLNHLILEISRNSGYLARQEIDKLLDKIRADPRRLEQHGFKVYSQNDEDGIITEIFDRLGIEKGTFCEIGIENGLECNTLFLIHKGWKGIWLEGNQAQKEFITSKFNSILENKRLGLGIEYITPSNVNEVVSKYLSFIGCDSTEIDFLSIDIDGMDIYLLESVSFNPKVICIEYNSKFPPPVVKKPVLNESFIWDGSDYMGASLNAIEESANQKGYSLVGTNITGVNAFFIRNDLLKQKFAQSQTAALYNPPRYYLFTNHYQTLRNIGHPPSFGPYLDLS